MVDLGNASRTGSPTVQSRNNPMPRILIAVKARALVPLLLLIAAPGWAQRTQREPKILLLPIIDQTVQPPSRETLNTALARAKAIQVINEKALETLSPALAQAKADQDKIDLGSPSGWSKDNLKLFARQTKAEYVTAIMIQGLTKTEAGYEVKVTGWLYELRFDRFVFESKETVFLFTPKEGAKPTNDAILALSGLEGAMRDMYRSFLAPFPKKAKKPKKTRFEEAPPVERIGF